MARKLDGSKSIQSGTITSTQLSSSVTASIEAGGGPRISGIIYPGDDTAANTVGGQTIYLTGSGFDANAEVYINGSAVPSVSFISASNVGFTTPALSAATYPVYLINPDDGATAILVPGISISGEPSWVTGATLSEQDASSAWNISLSATGDAPLTYALAAGSSLPSGISLASNGTISGTITTPPETDTTYNFTVVATDAQNQDSSRAFSVTASAGEGVLFANNVLLIHADGTNNGNNHAFLDSSNNNFTITRNGNATQGSFSPFSQTGWSNYFDGSGDSLTLASNAAFAYGTGAFTIEAWVYLAGDYSIARTILGREAGDFNFYITPTNGYLAIYTGSAQASTTAVSRNKWVHVAVVREGTGTNQTKLYVDGVSVHSFTNSTNFSSTANYISLNVAAGSDYWLGYISNLRVVKGTALYTTNFTPPTSPLTAVANTSLLTCQSNRFIDNSTNAFTITRNGDVSIQAFSPFAPTAAYTTANVGGSVYLDGTGDYLNISNNSALQLGSSNFTLEAFIYLTAYSASYGGFYGSTIFGKDASGGREYVFQVVSTASSYTGLVFYLNPGSGNLTESITGNATINLNTWYHVAVVRNGNSIALYLNGSQIASQSMTSTISSTSTDLRVGSGAFTSYEYYLPGYISNARLVKGTAVYTGSTYTVPSAPLTNIANTSLLCNFTNAQIFDQTAKNVLETVGNAKVSTAQYKYGTGSIDIPSTSDAVRMPGVDLRGDFTIEGWVKPSISGGEKFFIVQGVNQINGFLIGLTTNEIRWRSNGTTDISAVISKADWYHFAITRSGSGSNNVKVFVDGTQVVQGTYTNTILASAGVLNIGPGGTLSGSFASYGYIDEFRITRGFARYTANFTAPTAKFKDK